MEYWDHTMGPSERAALRAGAVQAALDGERKRDVAQRYGVTRQTLHNWLAQHRLGGTAALAGRPRGRVRRPVLEAWQEALAADTIALLSPATVNLRYSCWTKKAVAGFIEQRFGVRLSAWQVDSHLRRWGFRSHKEVRRAFMTGPSRGRVRELPFGVAVEAAAGMQTG